MKMISVLYVAIVAHACPDKRSQQNVSWLRQTLDYKTDKCRSVKFWNKYREIATKLKVY